MKSKNVVVGIGEIGLPIKKLLSKKNLVVGFDKNSKLVNQKEFRTYEKLPTISLHICIPFTKKFIDNVISLNKRFNPKLIIIHSTIRPYTTKKLQNKVSIPVIYSATRGIHKQMLSDLKRYTKFFAIEKNAPNKKWAISFFTQIMKKCNVKTKKMSNPISLELAKIVCDTSYYGWLINYAQLSNMIALEHKVNYDEMWSFSDEIHKNLGNRPKMFPGYIGGHCVIPNLELIDEDALWEIKKINNMYAKKVKNAKSIAKKYVKGKNHMINKNI